MSLEYKWKETTHEVYRAIYDAHYEEFGVFATVTSQRCWLTEWGFKDGNVPLIKSVREQGKYLREEINPSGELYDVYEYLWKYYILRKVVVDE